MTALTNPATLVLVALLLPAASFLIIGVLPPLRRAGRVAAWFSIACMVGSLAAAIAGWVAYDRLSATSPIYQFWTWLPAAQGPFAVVGVVVDRVSSTMLLLVTLVASLVQIYSTCYLSDEPSPALGRYYALQSLFAFSMMGVVLAPNLLQLFICWELVGVCSCLLIGFWYRKPEAARAALKAFWMTKLGDVGLLVGIVLLHRATGTFDLFELRALAEAHQIPVAGLWIITFGLYMGAAGKSAQFPLHVWLPDAMEGPTPVSALIHAATMVTAGVYLLTRTEWLFALTPTVMAIVCWNGAFTALLAATLACVQTDIKRVLAYSTVSQLGYMMAAIGAGFAMNGFLHLLTHGVFKALLFLGAGAVIHAVGSNDVNDMGGLARKMPQTAIVFLIGTLSLAGIPLFAGFASKEEVLGSVWVGGYHVPFFMLLFAAFLTAFYMFRVVFLAFWGAGRGARGASIPDPRSTHLATRDPRPALRDSTDTAHHGHGHGGEPGHLHDAPFLMTGPLWVLALLAMAIGLYFTFNAPGHELTSPGWLSPAAITAAVAGIVLAFLTYQQGTISADALASAFGPIRAAAVRKFWLDDLFLAIYGRVLLVFSRAIGWIDRYLVDGVLNVISAWTLDAGDRLRRMQTGKVQDYVWAVGLGLLALMAWIGVTW